MIPKVSEDDIPEAPDPRIRAVPDSRLPLVSMGDMVMAEEDLGDEGERDCKRR